ncbi:MAG: tetratricopeptide repeat protein [Nitrospiraceae bacterium]
MNRWATCSGLMVCTGILTVLLFPATSFAAACEPWIAKAMAVEGKVDVRHTDEMQWQPVKLHDTFCPGDVIRVQERSRADIALANQPMLRLDQNTTMTLGGVKPTGGSLVELAKGAAHFFSRLPRNLEVRTAFVNAGVEGTEGVVRVTDDRAEVTIFEGKVVAANEAGTLSITDGQSIVAEKGKAPAYRTVVNPRDAVQWALYYPPVLDVSPDEAVRENDPRSLAGRAARSLSVGRVDEATADLDRALKLDPQNSDALALQSVIAVVQNDKDKAMTLAQQAVAADPNSASAKTALSYAQQARFDLDGARKTLEEEVKAHPENALAWARLAELRASFSDLDGALEAAQKAVALNPNISRTQTVLGFAHLLRVDLAEAKAAFNKAIELDQSDAMPRLGLGLAKFRDGKVEEGRREMEVAASLDPNNSMVRSYLGKAYFEEKRDNLTEREYATAKELDPKDPTPFFYDALQKQLTNRPVEALKDMENAIELNKNRAVYRSQLQIDSDVAARSSSLARIYSNLGFQQVALVEGWSSVGTDDTSFTAHRFLADSYAALPRHEVARVSELFRSQLLQPLNVTPIQPSLAESNLFLLSALGPIASSFNEFNTLMVNRDRLTLQANGLAGTQHTLAGEAIVSGIFNKLSFSGGWSTFDTDGWRKNAFQNDQIGNVFLQFELTPRTMIQGEFRRRKTENGDLQLNFFKGDFDQNFRQETKRDTYRVGVRHEFSPNSMLLGSFMYQKRDDLDRTAADDGFGNTFRLDSKAPGQVSSGGELQHLFRSKYINVTSGFGYFDFKREQVVIADLDIPGFGTINLVNSRANLNAKHTNAYMYSFINPLSNLTFTLGVSGDFYDTKNAEVSPDQKQINPKFGMVWNPLPGTTVRAAAFRSLTRALITSQTLEPTQVAGFNQFYDDFESTEAWRYGGAVNQKFSRTVFGGVEYSQRDMDVPLPAQDAFGGPLKAITQDWHEKLGRAYLFWTPHDWVAVTAEYQYERFIRGEVLNFGVKNMEAQRIPLGLNVFHPSGLSLSIRPTYIHQQGSFQPRFTTCCQSGEENVWTVDAGLSYRLPNRYGLFTVGARNLFNENFQFQETDLRNPTVSPKRLVFMQLTLALP